MAQFAQHRAGVELDCIVGLPSRAVGRLREYEAAGGQRVFLNHALYDDIDMLELVAPRGASPRLMKPNRKRAGGG
jgi:alkanesulfonate monooxygenase SsuD/methylene tetrahydromethanopterin reductase-like flavin-dependent oxidoreductase (luciferase family)